MENNIKGAIVYQDEFLIAINKPAGLLSQSGRGGEQSVKEQIESILQHEIFILNRIDRPVSGIVMFAKSKRAAAKFSESLKKAEKKYIAIVENKPQNESGTLEDYLQKTGNKSIVTDDKEKGQIAKLKFRVIGQGDNYHYLEVILSTGRYHQIRAQLANISCLIMGDVKYGARRGLKDRSIGLHAFEITLSHPFLLKEITIKAPFPEKSIWADVKTKLTLGK